MTLRSPIAEGTGSAWHAMSAAAAVQALGSHAETGLTGSLVITQRDRYGPNEIASPPPPSTIVVVLRQLADPMNLMLIAVLGVSLFLGEHPVAVMVGVLVVLNVVLSTMQELKARAAVDALARMQTPQARVVREGSLSRLPAPELVPGDVVALEAGDLVPADGRLIRSATLETQEAALTGESVPVAKDADAVLTPDTGLGDRITMVFQNTTVTRGTARMLVTETGMNTQVGQIAEMLSQVEQVRSPLQRELDGLTKVLGVIAWAAVGVIVVIGIVRGQSLSSVLLVGIAMAVSAIPTGLPTFVQALLAYGARQLASHQAVVKNLSDVETLGATSAINSDKTGTLTLNEMMVRSLYHQGRWYSVAGEGYAKNGAIRCVAGEATPDFSRLALGLCLCSDATVSDAGEVVGDPTEAALVVLAAKMGSDAEETRRAYPRFAEVPFDSAYKFMATFHHLELDGATHLVQLVKGGPDVVLARCGRVIRDGGATVPIEQARQEILEANEHLSAQGLRVLAFAVRLLDGQEQAVTADPMALVEDLAFVGMVGIIDPLRAEAVTAVRTAQVAGIEVRMITGDHATTAGAIGAELGLGEGAISGQQLQAMTDAEVVEALPRLHVFGRVTPQDKLRLARLMQERGDIVAMTGDAVNDAAALKQADIGVAMGSGSEVTKQSARMILTDDNFETLVTAIHLGRGIYDKITCYIRFQMAQLFSLVMLFLAASVLGINNGVALTPTMVLFLNFFVCIFPVAVIMYDPAPGDLMSRPPRDPNRPIASGRSIRQWLLYGGVLFLITLTALLLGPGELSVDEPSVPITMAFVVMGLGTILSGLVLRRDPASGLQAPLMGAVRLLAVPVVLVVLAVESSVLQRMLDTASLTGGQWLACLGLSLVLPVVVEAEKAWRRRFAADTVPRVFDAADTVAPRRARGAATGPRQPVG